MAEQAYVMVIEDSATQALRLRLILERHGFYVECFVSAEAALETIGPATPDVIVVDYHLPGMRGDEFARQIRLNVGTRGIPVLVLTEAGTAAIEQKAYESGVDAFIDKSADPDMLVVRIQTLLRKSRRLASALGGDALFRRANLLIVDDSATYLEYLKSQLEREGYNVTPTENGGAARAAIAVQDFDCVVVDLIMPGINGIELCEQIDSRRREQDVWFPIIILTGQESKEDMMRGFEAGADDFVNKSSDIAMLKARVRALLRRKFLHEENSRISVEYREKELQLARAHSEKEVAEARAALHSQLQSSYDELERTNQKLRETQAQLVHSAKMASLGELVAGIAHEINNPLAFVIANQVTIDKLLTDIAGGVSLPADLSAKMDKARNRLQTMLNGLDRIKNIVLNLRTFLALMRASLKGSMVSESIDSVIMLLEHLIKGNVEIVKNYCSEESLFCSPAVLNQVVMNILANAIDAIEKGGTIFVSTRRRDGLFLISVEDNGCGIPADIRERIFEPFFTTKPVGRGTGLGLAIAYSIVQAHKGTIEIQSEVGRGTTFTVQIPTDLETIRKIP